MPRQRLITCEICGERTTRKNNEKRKFMARFPKDEIRCRQWVKAAGKEDLAYVPIEKLHLLKYVCGNHFVDKAFNRKRNRLKKSAVPVKNLKADPLPDEVLLEFPFHINSNVEDGTDYISREKCFNQDSLFRDEATAGPSNTALTWNKKNPEPSKKELTSKNTQHIDLTPTKETQSTNVITQEFHDVTEDYLDDLILDDDEDAELDKSEQGSLETPPFSWLQKEELVLDADLQPDPVPEKSLDIKISKTESPIKTEQATSGEQSASPAHEGGYHCDVCLEQINGFRYACVECADWDMCGACEARGAHPLHYVLRIPPHRPHAEVRARLRSIRRALADAVVHVVPDADTIDEIKEEEEYLEDPIDVSPSETVTNIESKANANYQDETDSDDEAESNIDETENNLDEAESSLDADESIQEVAEFEQSVAKEPTKKIFLEVVPLQSAKYGKLVTPCVRTVQKVVDFDQAVKDHGILKHKPFESSIVQKESDQRLIIVRKEPRTLTVQKTPFQSPQGVCLQSQIVQKAPLQTQTMRKPLPLKAQFIKKIVTPDGCIVEKAIRAIIVRNAPSDQKNSSQSAVDSGEMEKIRAVMSNVQQPSVAGPLRVQALPAGSAAAQTKKKITILMDRRIVEPDPPGTATIPIKKAVVRMERLSGTAIDEATRARKRRRLADSHTRDT